MTMGMATDLRSTLDEITESRPVIEQLARITQLRAQVGHSIHPLESDSEFENYMCAVYAFRLTDNRVYARIATSGRRKTFAGREFIEFLLSNGLLTARALNALASDDLAIYFAHGTFQHVGRVVTPDRILSKWGTGYLYDHGVWEVPLKYGDEVRYFVGVNADECLQLFIRYAKSKGFAPRSKHA